MGQTRDVLIIVALVGFIIVLGLASVLLAFQLNDRLAAPAEEYADLKSAYTPTPVWADDESNAEGAQLGSPTQASVSAYVSCLVEVQTEVTLLYSNRVSIDGQQISLSNFSPSDLWHSLLRESCQPAKPEAVTGERPSRQCIRQALIAIERDFGFVTGGNDRERRLAGLAAWDACSPYGR